MEDTRDYVAEATEQGWNPDFEGDKKVDAKTFVEKGERIAGIAQSQRERDKVYFEGKIAKLESSHFYYPIQHSHTIPQQLTICRIMYIALYSR